MGNGENKPLCFCNDDHDLNNTCILRHHFTPGSNMIKLFKKLTDENRYCRCVKNLKNYDYIWLEDLDQDDRRRSIVDVREYFFKGHDERCPVRNLYLTFIGSKRLPKDLNKMILSYVVDLDDWNL